MSSSADAWPPLPFAALRPTAETLQLWTQIVGKVRLARTPWVNHSLARDALRLGARPHHLADPQRRRPGWSWSSTSSRTRWSSAPPTAASGAIALQSGERRRLLRRGDGRAGRARRADRRSTRCPTRCRTRRRSPRTTRRAPTTRRSRNAFWRALVQVDRVFQRFRSRFLGKVQPGALLLGRFDLAVTRFSGRRAPLHPGGVPHLPDAVTREAYSHEVSSAGFWPGGGGAGRPGVLLLRLSGAGRLRGRARSRRPPPASTRRWASSCCPTRRSARRPTRTRPCSPSCRAPTRPPPTSPTGTAPPWSATKADRACPGR